MPLVRVKIAEGVRLFFDVAGTALALEGGAVREKPTLLVLHGGPGFDHTVMRPWFDRFADIAQVVWYDQRGHGRSDGWDDPGSWKLDTWADDVVRFCNAVGITSPVVVGNSWGGTVAMHYAARHADHPWKLILSSCSARRDIRRKVEAFRRLHGDEVAAVAEGYWTDPDEYRLRYRELCLPLYTVNRQPVGATSIMNADVATHFIREERSLDLLDELGGVRCETLVLAGEQDPVCPIEDALDIVSALPANLVRFERLVECGHGCFRDQPKLTEAILREFLSPS